MISFPKLLVLLPLILLSACVSLLPDTGEPPKRIWLEPAMISSPFRDHNNALQTVAITRPTATNMLDSERFRIRDLRGNIALVDHIAGIEWQEHLPVMVQRHLIQALILSKKFKAVGFEEDSFNHAVVLETDIQKFDVVVLKDKMYAEIELSAKLLEVKGRDVIWQKAFTSKAPIKSHSLEAFITGLTKAYENTLYQITQDVN